MCSCAMDSIYNKGYRFHNPLRQKVANESYFSFIGCIPLKWSEIDQDIKSHAIRTLVHASELFILEKFVHVETIKKFW